MIHACTIATRHYMAHMRVLVESFLRQNPDSRIWVLLADEAAASEVPDHPRVQALGPLDIGVDEAELHRRATMFVAQGFATSLKPNLLLWLLERGEGPALFIDADGCIYDDLSSLGAACEAHGLLLSPHTLEPYPYPQGAAREGAQSESAEQVILRAGTINSGFVGAGSGAEPALRWWASRTARRCVFEPQRSIMFDQTWLTLACCLFDHEILRDRGCNVAGWNLHTRDVEWDGETPRIDGGPLRHFHFAGSFNPEHPETITPVESIARWWTDLAERPGAARLVREYAQRLIACGYRETRALPARHDRTPEGMQIAQWMREAYRLALIDAEARGLPEPPNPFSDGDAAFREWLAPRAAQASAGSVSSGRGTEGGEQEGGARAGEDERGAGAEEPEGASAWRSAPRSDALSAALLDAEATLARIAELEGIRDEAVQWAQRASADLQEASTRLREIEAERDQLAAERDRHAETLQSMSDSASWRLTRPLRSAKSVLGRDERR